MELMERAYRAFDLKTVDPAWISYQKVLEKNSNRSKDTAPVKPAAAPARSANKPSERIMSVAEQYEWHKARERARILGWA